MAEKKIYCGSGRKQNNNWLKVTINPEKIMEHVQEFKGNKFIKLDINIKDEPDQYGKDVVITIDTWQPDKKENRVEVAPEDNQDLPF